MGQENERLATKNDSTFVRFEGMFAQLEILLARTKEHYIRLETDEASKGKVCSVGRSWSRLLQREGKENCPRPKVLWSIWAVVRGQLGDRVHLLDGGEKGGLEVSGVNWRQLENAAEKHDLGKLTAFFKAWSSVAGWPRSWPTCSSDLITCWATDVGPFFLFLGLGSASIWIGNSARMSGYKFVAQLN